MEILECSPISFKISRRSTLASNLKSSISDSLVHFLGNFADDTLAEYITILVCNGKHQYEATEDLKEFLEDRSGEFVSWLWDLLLKYAHQSKKDICLLEVKDSTVPGPCGSDTDKDSTINRLNNFVNHGGGNNNLLLNKDDNLYYPPAAVSTAPFYSGTEFAEGFHLFPGFTALESEMNLEELVKESCKDNTRRFLGDSENVLDDSLIDGKGSSSVIAAGRDTKQTIQCVNKREKIAHSSSKFLPNQVMYLPNRQSAFGTQQPSTTGNVPFPGSVDTISYQNGKYRGSVWDRLDKPYKERPLMSKTVDVCGVGTMMPKKEELNNNSRMLLVLNHELSGNMTAEVSRLGNSLLGNNHPKSRKLVSREATVCEPHIVNNIRRKRHFGEISIDHGALVSQRTKDLQCKKFSENLKASSLMSQNSKPGPNLILEVLDVKKKLRKIQLEMCKLRAKQLEIQKDEKSNLFSHSGGIDHATEDSESRTVFVTNVHFAATREGVASYFAKCGVVENVVILIDKVTSQTKGSAYVTFASKDSVAKALSLSGTAFCSRILKVTKKVDASATTSESAQLVQSSSQPLLSQVNKKAIPNKPYFSSSHQWRRDSATSKPSN